ncbi:hypothetical protein [Eubacterium sp.]|uniref:hypothetical protein n=1 Tax=Eubacterium sp. TaxID=142586 RepID=UPI0025833422|nr:hypothetical protein [Eubacterium sp.]MCR5367716.1 hypothetical protein [Eubacterium sp.]
MNKKNKDKDKGFVSIEAAFIGAIAMIIVIWCLFAMVYVMNVEIVRDGMYMTVYSTPLKDKDSYVNSEAEKSMNEEILIWCDEYKVGGTASGDSIKMIGAIDMKGTTVIECQTESDICTKRLRRWQMYDNLSEESLGE